MQGFQKEAEVIKSETKETSQEDLVKFIVNVAYVGSNIRIGFKIMNNSDFGISDVYIKLIHSDQLSLFRIKPKFDFDKISSGISIKLPKIREKSQLALNVYFKADTLGIGEIKGQFQYVNYQDFVRFIRIENLFYNLNPPKIVPKEIPTFEIEEYTKKEGIKRDIRSYGLPDNLNPNVAFNHISQIIKNYNFKLITKNEQPDQSIIWYFGETEDQEFSVLVVGQIINNKIEFYASSKNEQIISALLTAFSIDLKKRIINSHVVSSEEEIYDLYCDSCGGVLPYFPKPGEKVICKWCNNEVTVR
jgi:hypothetical protein